MNTATSPAEKSTTGQQAIAMPDIFSHTTPLFWTTGLLRATSQILSLSVAVGAVRAGVKGSRASVAFGVAGVAALTAYKLTRQTPPVKEAFRKEFGLTLEGPALNTSHLKKTDPKGFPFVASRDGVQGVYTLHEKDGLITVTDPAGATLQRMNRR